MKPTLTTLTALTILIASTPAYPTATWELVPGTGGCTAIAIDPDGIYCRVEEADPPPVTIISDSSEFPRIRWEGPDGLYSLGLDMMNDQFTYDRVLTKEVTCPADPEDGSAGQVTSCETIVFATHGHTYRYRVYSRNSGEYSGYWIVVY